MTFQQSPSPHSTPGKTVWVCVQSGCLCQPSELTKWDCCSQIWPFAFILVWFGLSFPGDVAGDFSGYSCRLMYCKWRLRMQQSEKRSYHASPCYEKVKFPSVISGFVYLNRQVKISLWILRVSVSGWAQGIPVCWPPMIPDIFPIESQHREMLHFFFVCVWSHFIDSSNC